MRTTLPAMRALLLVASALVLIIGTPMLLVPTSSDTLFSWTVNPPVTAAFLGAGYVSSFLLEFLSSREKLWVRTRAAVPSVLVFTVAVFLVTVVHLEKFHLGGDFSLLTQAITWVWLAVYAAVPIVMAGLLVAQMRMTGDDPPRVAAIARWVRIALVFQSVVFVAVGTALLVDPSATSPGWPWALSDLTGRAIGAFLLGTGVVAAHSAWENDLVRITGPMAAYCSFGFLQVVSVLRFATANDPRTAEDLFDWSSLEVWLYLAFFTSVGVVGLIALRSSLKAKRSGSSLQRPGATTPASR